MSADDFITMIKSPNVLGDPLLKTQHFIGGTRWEKVSEQEIVGHHQLRVPHQRYTDATMTTVKTKGHAHSTNKHWYKKVDGVWKFAGLTPDIRWGEYDFDRIFEDGREGFSKKSKEKPLRQDFKSVDEVIMELKQTGATISGLSRVPPVINGFVNDVVY